MSGTLAGRTAVVTGASRGIGLAIARALAAEGARVAMIARGAERLRSAARDLGDGTLAIPCDVGDDAAVLRAATEIERAMGVPHVLVSSAGIFHLESVASTTVAAFLSALETNLAGPFRFVHAFLAAMTTRGDGHVITIGSVADRATFPGNGAYAASKFGLRALHQVLREELRGTGVRATLVSPGPVDTPLWDAVDPDTRPGFTPRALMLSPEAIAAAVVWAAAQPETVNVDELRLSRS